MIVTDGEKEVFTGSVCQVAKSWDGQEEIVENQGFKDPDFRKAMDSVYWFKGAPWCAFYAKLCYMTACKKVFPIEGDIYLEMNKVLSGSVELTYRNAKKSTLFDVGAIPSVGAIVCWGEGIHNGHAGIVFDYDGKDTFKTIEGNTNDNGSRNGYKVCQHVHSLSNPGHNRVILGFVNLKVQNAD